MTSMEAASLEEIITAVALSRECQLQEAELQAVNSDISKLEQEIVKLNLEKQWCFDGKDNRTIPAVEERAMKICQELAANPDCLEETVKTLRMKRIDLQCCLKDLEFRCSQLKEEIRKF